MYKEVALLRLSSSSSLDHTSDKFPLYSSLALLYPVTLFSSSDTLVKSLLSTPHCNCSVAGKLPQAFSQSSNYVSTTLLWPLRLPESTTCLNFCLIAFSFVVNICLVTSSVCWQSFARPLLIYTCMFSLGLRRQSTRNFSSRSWHLRPSLSWTSWSPAC